MDRRFDEPCFEVAEDGSSVQVVVEEATLRSKRIFERIEVVLFGLLQLGEVVQVGL